MLNFIKRHLRRRVAHFSAKRTNLVFYFAPPRRALQLVETPSFISIKSRVDFVNVFPSAVLDEYVLDRFSKGHELLCLVIDGELCSRGWVCMDRIFFDTESRQNILNDGFAFLYDFETPTEHRRKGYYTLLLKNIITLYPSRLPFIIFASKNNLVSNKAICNAGFTKINSLIARIVLPDSKNHSF